MRRLVIRIAAAILAFLLGVAATAVWLSNRSAGENGARETEVAREEFVRASIPMSRWVPMYFRTINKHAYEAGLPRLGTVLLPDGDLEVRVWVGFGTYGEDALILRRAAGQWSAVYLHGTSVGNHPPPERQEAFAVSPPKSGWERAWQKLTDAGITTLPDASEVQCNTPGLDGMSFVVEVNQNRNYRTYRYNNPNPAKCDEAKRMIKIGTIISEEFGLEEFEIVD